MAQKLKFGNGTWATKEGSTLAYNDERGNFKPLPFTTTRNSIATRVNKEGLIEVVGNDVPRIDYTDSADGVLLLENSSTNLVAYSEDFSQSSWTKNKTTITSNSVVSPDGALTADKLVEDNSIGEHFVYDLLITSSGNFSHSIFAKAEERSKIRISSGSNLHKVDFDLSNGTIILEVGATGSIDSVANGWYKLTLSWNEPSVVPQYSFISLLDDNGLDSYQGNGSSGLYIWGSQYEQLSYPTSYIPTSGSTVQRQADVANGSGNSEVFNDSEGVLFADVDYLTLSGGDYFGLNDGTNNQRVLIQRQTTNIKAYINSGVELIAPISSTINKISVSYKSNNYKLYLNGFKVATNTSSSVTPSGLNAFEFELGGGIGLFAYLKTKEIGYYDEILTDEELEYLTSYRSLNELVTELNLNTL